MVICRHKRDGGYIYTMDGHDGTVNISKNNKSEEKLLELLITRPYVLDYPLDEWGHLKDANWNFVDRELRAIGAGVGTMEAMRRVYPNVSESAEIVYKSTKPAGVNLMELL